MIWEKEDFYFLENAFKTGQEPPQILEAQSLFIPIIRYPLKKARKEVVRLLHSTPLCDEKTKVLQVNDATPTTCQIRIPVSTKNFPTAWDLRVYIRKKMIEYIRKNFPGSLPCTRVMIEEKD